MIIPVTTKIAVWPSIDAGSDHVSATPGSTIAVASSATARQICSAASDSTTPGGELRRETRDAVRDEREREQRGALGPLRADEQDPDDGEQHADGRRGDREHVDQREVLGIAGEGEQATTAATASATVPISSQKPARVSVILRSSTGQPGEARARIAARERRARVGGGSSDGLQELGAAAIGASA